MTTLAIDCGYGHVKALCGKGFTQFPHALGTPDPVRHRTELTTAHPLTIRRDKETYSYYVGDAAISQSRHAWTHVARKRDAWELRALLAFAATHLNITEPVTVVSGLPVAWYAEDRNDHVSALQGTLEYQYLDTWKKLEVAEVKVLPQPMGSYYYAAQSKPEILEPDFYTGVIDIGHFTTDCIRVRGGEYLAPDSFSIPVGIKRLQDDLIVVAQQAYIRELTPQQADKALRDGFVKVRGEQKKLLLDAAMVALSQEILARIDAMWQGALGLDGVIVTGGGAHLLFDAFKSVYPHAETVKEPELANVRGYSLYAEKQGGIQSRR